MENLRFLESGDLVSAIEEVVASSDAFRGVSDVGGFLGSVLERQRLGSTNLGHGVVAAHGQISGLGAVHVALGVSRAGIRDQASPEPLHFILVFCSDPRRYDLYVEKLSTLLGALHEEETRSAVLRGDFPDAVLRNLG